MNPLSASGADSQGVRYSLDNGTKTAKVVEYLDGNKMGKFENYQSTSFYINSNTNRSAYIKLETTTTGSIFSQTKVRKVTTNSKTSSCLFTIVSPGILVFASDSAYCLYFESNSSIVPKERSSISYSDSKHLWSFDGKHIISQYNGTYLTYSSMGGNVYSPYPTNTFDYYGEWSLEVNSGSTINLTTSLRIPRGVMEANGTMYKVTSIQLNAYTLFNTNIYFPHHRSSEITNPNGVWHTFGK